MTTPAPPDAAPEPPKRDALLKVTKGINGPTLMIGEQPHWHAAHGTASDGTRLYFALTYNDLYEWTKQQPPYSIVGHSDAPTDCPCSRCILDLGLAVVPEGMQLEVDSVDIEIRWVGLTELLLKSTVAVRAYAPQWLVYVIGEIDRLGTEAGETNLPITREALLAILESKGTRVLAGLEHGPPPDMPMYWPKLAEGDNA